MKARLLFLNRIDHSIVSVKYPVEMQALPEVGSLITTDNMGDGIVQYILTTPPPSHLLHKVKQMYGPQGYDGLPIIICITS